MIRNTVLRFVNAINNQDLNRIIEMMAEDFVFIDTYGDITEREQMKLGWKDYFDLFPDYKIEIQDYLENAGYAVILGKAVGSFEGKEDKRWELPAAWRVSAREDKITVWQVYCDSKKQFDAIAG